MSKIIIIYENGETRQEIGQMEVHLGADYITYTFHGKYLMWPIGPIAIDLPKPTKKVWKWKRKYILGAEIIDISTMDWFTEEQICINTFASDVSSWSKVEGSEKEVEE